MRKGKASLKHANALSPYVPFSLAFAEQANGGFFCQHQTLILMAEGLEQGT
jgi:hypothetical protein